MAKVLVSYEKLGANIRRLRVVRGWSVEELADRAYATIEFICDAETGKRRLTVEAVMTLCDALEIEPSELLDGITESK